MPAPSPSAPFSKSGPPPSGRAARTFKPRRGRLTRSEAEAVDALLPAYLLEPRPTVLDERQLVIDIGFGNGETTVALAMEHPASTVLAIDVHTPGMGVLARALHEGGFTNVRIVDADALDVVTWMCAPGAARLINVSFPDPWKKPSQYHRRLVDASFIDLVATRLASGGELRFASDWEHYARVVTELLSAHMEFERADPWTSRPTTKFERRALAAGRVITDLAYRRR